LGVEIEIRRSRFVPLILGYCSIPTGLFIVPGAAGAIVLLTGMVVVLAVHVDGFLFTRRRSRQSPQPVGASDPRRR
jgi:hypothetical protein